jgi:predicted peptidase
MKTPDDKADDPPGRGDPRSFQRVVTRRVEGRYLVSFPDTYQDDLQRDWPLLLFLHGADERGSDLQKVRRHGPLATSAPNNLPFVVVAPQCPDGEWWAADRVGALVDECREAYRIDERRIYATGISMGGTGVWDLAARRPGLFAAVAPVCGRADPIRARALRDVPVWAVHGAQDSVIPPEQSRTMVEAVRAAGGTARLTMLPDAGHDVWTETYADSDIYDWLLEHQRSAAGPA